jgi:hypothetical protein
MTLSSPLMELTAVSCANYKAFPIKTEIEIRPLTIFVGKNNAGKSILTRLPVLLAHALSSRAERPLDLRVGEVSFGTSFGDLIHRQDPHGACSLGATFSQGDEATQFRATVQSVSHGDQTDEVVASCQLDGRDLDLTLKWEVTPERPPRYRDVGPVEFRGLLPHVHNPALTEKQLFGLDQWRRRCDNFSNRISYLGPLRPRPEKVYSKERHRPGELGSDGEDAPYWLAKEEGLLDRVSAWYQEHLDGWRLKLESSFSLFQCMLERDGTTVHLADGGEGMSQVLPVVVQRLRHQVEDTEPYLDIVEHPELHLHPAAHRGLADLFVESARRPGARILVEIHSETFLLRLRRRVAEGKLDPSRVVLYWIEDLPNGTGSSVRKVEILADGELSDWPAGVFSESYEEVRAMRRAARARHGGEE